MMSCGRTPALLRPLTQAITTSGLEMQPTAPVTRPVSPFFGARPTGLTLMDFDTCSLADPAIDVGKFLADLQWWYASYGQPGVEEAQAHFLDAYSPGTPWDRLRRARAYEVLVLIRLAVHRLRLFDNNWAMRTEQLVERAEHLLRTRPS